MAETPPQTEFIARLVRGLHDRDLTSIVPKPDPSAAYNAKLQERLQHTTLSAATCTSWYRYKNTGKVIASSGVSGGQFFPSASCVPCGASPVGTQALT